MGLFPENRAGSETGLAFFLAPAHPENGKDAWIQLLLRLADSHPADNAPIEKGFWSADRTVNTVL